MATETASSGPGVPGGTPGKGLKGGALGLLSSTVIGVASTAPAYSLAATLGFIVVAVGVQSPAIILLAFVPMFFVALAYQELNKDTPDCGTTFTWAAKAFGPRAGWMGGWGIIAADVIVMANLAQIAGQYGFLLFGLDSLADSAIWTMVAGVIWIAAMTYICYRGIEISAKLQYVLLVVELIMLLLFAVVALYKVYAGSAPDGSLTPELSWFNPFAVSDGSALAEGVLLAVFIYWGWDTAVAINEETDDPGKTPGRAAVLSTLLLLTTYALVTVSAQAYAGTGTEGLGLGNEENSDDVLAALGDSVLGSGFNELLIIATLTSAAASTQTTILPTARATLSMAVYKALPKAFAKIHPRNLTPSVSTISMGIASIVFYVGLTLISGNVLGDSIASLGLLIAFYYGLTGFACAWYFRRHLRNSARDFFLKGLLPLLGGLFLLAAFVKSAIDMMAPDYGNTSFAGVGGVFLLGIGSLLLGVVLMIVWNVMAPPYFRGEVLNRDTPVLVPEGAEHPPGLALPDSTSQQSLVIPPEEAERIERSEGEEPPSR